MMLNTTSSSMSVKPRNVGRPVGTEVPEQRVTIFYMEPR